MTTSPEGRLDLHFGVGDRLRKARESTGLDRAHFAKEIGISRNSVTKYESGDEVPKPIVLKAWVMRTRYPQVWIETGVVPARDPDGGTMMGRSSSKLADVLDLTRRLTNPHWGTPNGRQDEEAA